MILQQFLSPINLFKTQTFCTYKIIETIIICKNKNFLLIIFKVIKPSFKHCNKS